MNTIREKTQAGTGSTMRQTRLRDQCWRMLGMKHLRRLALQRLPWLLLLLSPQAYAQQPLGCLIEPDYVAEVGSQVVGVIESMKVERGQVVRKGDVIAVLRADVERAAVGVARSRSEAVADIQAAAANAAFGKQRLDRAKDLLEKQFISDQAYDQLRAESEVANQKLAQAREQHRLSQRELELASSQLAMRTVRSPVNGVIAERYMSTGERIEEKPMVRVAVVDPLRVQVVAPSSMYGRIQLDSTATIFPELANAAPVSARVILIDKLLDSASNTFRVTLRLPNPGNALPAGLRCRADFGLGGTANLNTNGAARSPAAGAANSSVNGVRPMPNGKMEFNPPLDKPATAAGSARPR
jgi:membrane fusion protein, heavy metal efflux system